MMNQFITSKSILSIVKVHLVLEIIHAVVTIVYLNMHIMESIVGFTAQLDAGYWLCIIRMSKANIVWLTRCYNKMVATLQLLKWLTAWHPQIVK